MKNQESQKSSKEVIEKVKKEKRRWEYFFRIVMILALILLSLFGFILFRLEMLNLKAQAIVNARQTMVSPEIKAVGGNIKGSSDNPRLPIVNTTDSLLSGWIITEANYNKGYIIHEYETRTATTSKNNNINYILNSGSESPSLSWNTFIGGSWGTNEVQGITADGSGNVYVTGSSPITWGTPINAYVGSYDTFVAKFDNDGELLWNTFIGSSGEDVGRGIVVDSNGNIYIVGDSDMSWGTPVNAYSGGSDAFVAKLNSDGELLWNTFLGSAIQDRGFGITIDGNGNIYISGYSFSTWGSPVNAYPGGTDAFVAKLDNNGELLWNTFMGYPGENVGTDIALDAYGRVYVVGTSAGTWGSPVNAFTGAGDAFVAKLDNNGELFWNTFMGSANQDGGVGIAVDEIGNLYVTGISLYNWGNPIINAQVGNGNYDAFVAKLNNNGSLQWNTFMGSEGDDHGNDIAVDGNGNAYVVGQSTDTWGAPANPYTGNLEAFIARLNSSGERQWNTFLGSPNNDQGISISVDGNENVYVSGNSGDTWGNPINIYPGAPLDAFVAKLDVGGITFSYSISGDVKDEIGNAIPDVTVNLTTTTGEPVASAITGVDGSHSLANIPAGTYLIYANKTNYQFTPYPLTVVLDADKTGQNILGEEVCPPLNLQQMKASSSYPMCEFQQPFLDLPFHTDQDFGIVANAAEGLKPGLVTAWMDHDQETSTMMRYWGSEKSKYAPYYGNLVCDPNGPISLCYDQHEGTDFGLELNQEIYPAAPGVVVETCPSTCSTLPCPPPCSRGYGKYVLIDHENGYATLYGHLKAISVKTGDRFNKDTSFRSLGIVGGTGYDYYSKKIIEEPMG